MEISRLLLPIDMVSTVVEKATKQGRSRARARNVSKEVGGIRLAARREAQRALKFDVKAALARHRDELHEISRNHGRSIDSVEGMSYLFTKAAGTRGINLYNAWNHFISVELDEKGTNFVSRSCIDGS